MTPAEFMKDAIATSEFDERMVIQRLHSGAPSRKMLNLLNAAMGMAEGMEFSEHVKKYVFYGKRLEPDKMKEELGDLFWYMMIAIHEMGWTLEDVMDHNVAKRKRRYPEGKFSERAAVDRVDVQYSGGDFVKKAIEESAKEIKKRLKEEWTKPLTADHEIGTNTDNAIQARRLLKACKDNRCVACGKEKLKFGTGVLACCNPQCAEYVRVVNDG